MNKVKQTSLDQTGVAIYKIDDKEKIFPLFSLNPVEEANTLQEDLIVCSSKNVTLEHVFISNNLLEYKIEDEIRNFVKENGYLPEDLMDELLCGFPFSNISGYNTYSKYCYE